LNQDGGVGSVAGNGRHAALAQFLDDLTILLGDDKRYAIRGQCFADAPADPAITHQYDLSRQASDIDSHWEHCERIVGSF
jgi:hypothetical protein